MTERILNGGFEDFVDHWTCEGDGTGFFLPWMVAPYTGIFHLVCAPDVGDTWGISQSVNFTNVNTLTFWQYMGGSGVRVYIDDVLLDTFSSVGMVYYQQSVDVSGRSGIHTLKMLFADDEWTFIDDISAGADDSPAYWYDINTPKNVLGRQGNKTNKLGG